ncbi:MAG: hypothetical protein HXY22_00770 [Alphaproteobacteria bacterium]|nr:hypothetical protein [Alphaproteobacteria bacterium]
MTKVPTKVRFYRLRNRLRDKLGGGAPGTITIAPDALAAAQAAIDKMAEDYPDWVQSHLDQLRVLHARCVDTREQRSRFYAEIRDIAHNMKGQGGTFGYPLISMCATSLYDFTSPRAGKTDNHIEIIKAHIDSMTAIIKGRIKGNGGEIGSELMQNLNRAIAKYEVSDP